MTGFRTALITMPQPARLRTAAASLALAAVVAGCALLRPATPPLLRLAPAALGHELAVAQRITVSQPTPDAAEPERAVSADAVLEVDATSVRMAVLGLGQALLRIEWDGSQLTQTRAPGWPDAVDGAQILNDVQLALWPAQAIRSALPAGWTLHDHAATPDAPAQRWLDHAGQAVLRIDYPSTQRTVMNHLAANPRAAWRVEIESATPLPFAPPQP